MTDYSKLPENLPVPVDDGACDHLEGMRLPTVSLGATPGGLTDLSKLSGLTVLFCYPRTGVPGGSYDHDLQAWDLIPGARGCTVQACGFRDNYNQLVELQVRVFGMSTQTASTQFEAASRLHLPYPLLSDSKYALTEALQLPTFVYFSNRLLKRLTIIIQDEKIIKVFYPVFPPNEDAKNVANFLKGMKS